MSHPIVLHVSDDWQSCVNNVALLASAMFSGNSMRVYSASCLNNVQSLAFRNESACVHFKYIYCPALLVIASIKLSLQLVSV